VNELAEYADILKLLAAGIPFGLAIWQWVKGKAAKKETGELIVLYRKLIEEKDARINDLEKKKKKLEKIIGK